MNSTLTGAPTAASGPTGDSEPLVSIDAEHSERVRRSLAAISQRPLGSMAKFRGVRPRVGSYSTSVSTPLSPTEKTAML